MGIKNMLSLEQELLIITSRITITEDIKTRIDQIVKNNSFNWFDFFRLTSYHKTMTLCWKNITQVYSEEYIPKYLNDIIRSAYICIAQKNVIYSKAVDEVVMTANEAGITCIPVKGAYLVKNMYKDFGTRYSGDADFLVKYNEGKRLPDVLAKLGYTQCYYLNKKLVPFSRSELIKYTAFYSIFAPFNKLNDNEVLPVIKLDFRHSLDDNLSKVPVENIIDSYWEIGYVKPAHYLMHLITHFYDEAKHTLHIAIAKDLNIIKLCDIREYVLGFTTSEDLNELVDFAKKHKFEKQIYFTAYMLKLIYNDGYEQELMDRQEINDLSFLNTYGENQREDNITFKKTIIERMFSCGNLDELNVPSFSYIE